MPQVRASVPMHTIIVLRCLVLCLIPFNPQRNAVSFHQPGPTRYLKGLGGDWGMFSGPCIFFTLHDAAQHS